MVSACTPERRASSACDATAVRVSTYQTATSGVPPAANVARTSAVG
jgi:hypothetical protein